MIYDYLKWAVLFPDKAMLMLLSPQIVLLGIVYSVSKVTVWRQSKGKRRICSYSKIPSLSFTLNIECRSTYNMHHGSMWILRSPILSWVVTSWLNLNIFIEFHELGPPDLQHCMLTSWEGQTYNIVHGHS